MTRYFYTDPLAAAWMAKHFGMRFFTGDQTAAKWHDEPATDGTSSRIRVVDEWVECWTSDPDIIQSAINWPCRIHPDSLHLLEPQEGDLVTLGGQEEGAALLAGTTAGGFYYRQYGIAHHACSRGSVKQVIQRNSKPFHWPESEAA